MGPHEARATGPTAATRRLLLMCGFYEPDMRSLPLRRQLEKRDRSGTDSDRISTGGQTQASALPHAIRIRRREQATLEVQLLHARSVNLARRTVEDVAVEDDEVR